MMGFVLRVQGHLRPRPWQGRTQHVTLWCPRESLRESVDVHDFLSAPKM